VFENRFLKIIFGPKRDEGTGDMSSSIKYYYDDQIKEDEMGGVCSAHGGNAYKMLVIRLKGRKHSKDLDVEGRIILKWILGKYGLGVWIGFIWHMIGTGSGVL
jgi:hypothetical protein